MDLIPEGYYQARAVRIKDNYGDDVWARWGRAKTGTHQIVMKFQVTTDGEYKSKQLLWFGFFTDKSWERTFESLQYCGFQGDDMSTLDEQTLDREVSIKVEHVESETGDRKYARVAFVNASNTVGLANPMSRDEIRDFAAMMKGRIAGKRGGTSAPAPSPRKTDPLDKIPF